MIQRYWNHLTQWKFSLYVYQCIYDGSVATDRFLRIFIWTVTFASAVLWSQTRRLDVIWGSIIAVMQVVGGVNELLPYKKRITDLHEMIPRLSDIYNKVEKDWFFVSQGCLTEEEINEKLYSYVGEWKLVSSRYFYNDCLPGSKTLLRRAEKQKDLYFANIFKESEDDEQKQPASA